ncbi:MAG: dTDP-4-dehydrorhamnose reductase, partial [Candidatus Eremiobacteraeota bacterium]|nr:dTDP-4-dehydrorhamnose reductase [Candidatus Eremiobacteraeota bacterium]
NEPLTTARFSALYGLWYPHARDSAKFLLALLNQCAATRDAMEAIRAVIPDAQLVQTEDLGKIHSTPRLRYQADFENARRWLSFDLLTGNLEHNPAMHRYLRDHGLASGAESFIRNPCPPDILGLNYYVTSERFLDERVERYPEQCLGANGSEPYADVAAVRVCEGAPHGLTDIIADSWQRYQLPVAVTEVHLGCSVEEQVRWLHDIREAAMAARARGADVRAITAWSLFGAFDWNSLLTQIRGFYEPGAFDVRDSPPRATFLASAIKAFAAGEDFDHPVLDVPGWWRRDIRLEVTRHDIAGSPQRLERKRSKRPRPIVLWHCPPPVKQRLRRHCKLRGFAYTALDAPQFASFDSRWEMLVRRVRPWALIDFSSHNAVRPPIMAVCAQFEVRYALFPRTHWPAPDDEALDELIGTVLDSLLRPVPNGGQERLSATH